MTIAACYLSSEGVVFGADSTSTYTTVLQQGGNHMPFTRHLDHAQKIFEIGEHGTLGIVTWGAGRVGNMSHRTLVASVSDEWSAQKRVGSVQEAADYFAAHFWKIYSSAYKSEIQRFAHLRALPHRTKDEDSELAAIAQNLSGGYCVGGNWHDDRHPKAFEIGFGPHLVAPPIPVPMTVGGARFWGCPNIIGRMLFGIDRQVYDGIVASGKWNGTQQELDAIIGEAKLFQHNDMPLREAMDFVHATIHATIKAMKFSQLAAVCGGPIEIAVVASDRRFRWVKHKSLDQAVT